MQTQIHRPELPIIHVKDNDEPFHLDNVIEKNFDYTNIKDKSNWDTKELSEVTIEGLPFGQYLLEAEINFKKPVDKSVYSFNMSLNHVAIDERHEHITENGNNIGQRRIFIDRIEKVHINTEDFEQKDKTNSFKIAFHTFNNCLAPGNIELNEDGIGNIGNKLWVEVQGIIKSKPVNDNIVLARSYLSNVILRATGITTH